MKYLLREINRDDLKTINQWRNDKELIDLLGNNFLYIGEEIDSKWFENYLANRQTAIRLAILEGDSSQLIGTIQLTSIHLVNRSAEFSIMVGNKDYWSKGAGNFATVEMLRHGFRNMNLNRIFLTVLESNIRAISLYEKIGFKKEGIQREPLFKNGQFVNLIMMSVLSAEFKEENS